MISVLFKPMVDAGLTEDRAWRASMAFPAMMMIACAFCVKCLCWDMPTGKHYDPRITGKTENPSVGDYREVIKDFRVVVMIFQYSACFGCELAMNNQLATHFRTGLLQPMGNVPTILPPREVFRRCEPHRNRQQDFNGNFMTQHEDISRSTVP